jgi:tRNA 2-thiouridine synthesizing protein A
VLTEGPDASQATRPSLDFALVAPTHTVDVRGLPCPLPLVRLAEAVRGLAPGARVRLLGTDAALRTDLAAWCAATGHRLLWLAPLAEVLEAWVEVAPVQS